MDINTSIGESGETPLIESCKLMDKRLSEKITVLLLKRGAKINQTDIHGRNALHWACLQGKRHLVSLLLKHFSNYKIELNATDLYGNTALFFAVKTGNCSFVHFLVAFYQQYGVQDHGIDANGQTVVEYAFRHGHKSCAKELLKVCRLSNATIEFTGSKSEKQRNRCSLVYNSPVKSTDGFDVSDVTSLSNKGPKRLRAWTDASSFDPDNIETKKRVDKNPDKKTLRLPKLKVGLPVVRKAEPELTESHEIGVHYDINPKDNGSFNGDNTLPANMNIDSDQITSSNYKGLLVNFNNIISIENSQSYRKGATTRSKSKEFVFVKPNGKSDKKGSEMSERTDSQQVKQKLRKISKVNSSNEGTGEFHCKSKGKGKR